MILTKKQNLIFSCVVIVEQVYHPLQFFLKHADNPMLLFVNMPSPHGLQRVLPLSALYVSTGHGIQPYLCFLPRGWNPAGHISQ